MASSSSSSSSSTSFQPKWLCLRTEGPTGGPDADEVAFVFGTGHAGSERSSAAPVVKKWFYRAHCRVCYGASKATGGVPQWFDGRIGTLPAHISGRLPHERKAFISKALQGEVSAFAGSLFAPPKFTTDVPAPCYICGTASTTLSTIYNYADRSSFIEITPRCAGESCRASIASFVAGLIQSEEAAIVAARAAGAGGRRTTDHMRKITKALAKAGAAATGAGVAAGAAAVAAVSGVGVGVGAPATEKKRKEET